MKLPNAEHAVIEQTKLVDYLLNVDHLYGGPKARLLQSLGYSPDDWQRLELDIRAQLQSQEVILTKDTAWGIRYQTIAALRGSKGNAVRFRCVWQVDRGTNAPRLITMYPE